MLGIFKRNKLEEEDKIDNNQVERYLDAFMAHNNIDPNKVLVRNIYSCKRPDGFFVEINVAFPGPIVGHGGRTIKALAKGLTKHIGKQMKVVVRT